LVALAGPWELRSDDGDIEGSFAAYECALACDCDRASVAYNYAEALVRAGRWEDAEAKIAPLFDTGEIYTASAKLGLYLVNLYEDILRNAGREAEAETMIERHADVIAREAKLS